MELTTSVYFMSYLGVYNDGYKNMKKGEATSTCQSMITTDHSIAETSVWLSRLWECVWRCIRGGSYSLIIISYHVIKEDVSEILSYYACEHQTYALWVCHSMVHVTITKILLYYTYKTQNLGAEEFLHALGKHKDLYFIRGKGDHSVSHSKENDLVFKINCKG